MKRLAAFTLTVALGTLAETSLPAQEGKVAPTCRSTAEQTISGTAESVRQHAGWMGWDGVYVTLRDGNTTYEVHLAPASFLAELGMTIERADTIQVKGCVARVDSQDVVVAREVRKQNVVLNLRDQKGRPVW